MAVRDVIEFWRAVEMFSAPSIPQVSTKAKVFDIAPGEPLPWSADHPVHAKQPRKGLVWRYTIFGGVFPIRAISEALKKRFPPPDEYEETRNDESALFALSVSAKGFLLAGSPVLSASVWAMSSALALEESSRRWLDGFDGDAGQFCGLTEEEFLPKVNGVTRPVFMDRDAVDGCVERAKWVLGLDDDFPVAGIRVRCEEVGPRGAETVEHDFLNSFIADDLGRVARAAEKGRVGGALREYLRPTAELDLSGRVDVRDRLDEVRRATGPDRVPLGRWPADPERPLALGQQLAVNEAIAMRGDDAPLFAVNGPPGTGKTTMLRDLVAALVTERAERLAKLADPRQAFVKGELHEWEAQTHHSRAVPRLKPELTGFEMVVASSNNTAVDNVTLELPSMAAIDPVWRDRARDRDDLRLLAELAIDKDEEGTGRGSRSGEETAWALIAARLGRSKNRSNFRNAVWWTPRKSEDEDGQGPPPRLQRLLGDWVQGRHDPLLWKEAVEAFNQAHRRAASIRDDRAQVADALDRLRKLPAEIEMAREDEREAAKKVLASKGRRDELKRERRDHEGEIIRLRKEREEDRAPFVLRFIARAEWRTRHRRYPGDIEVAEERLGEAVDEMRPLEEEIAAHEEAHTRIEALSEEGRERERLRDLYRERPGAVLPDEDWLVDQEARDLRAPWSDVEWNEARTELFLAALALHRAFLVGAAAPMQQALYGAMDIISGAAPRDLEPAAALAAWQALFMVVPVVSTTFSSLGRLFDPLGREALGWLLVDEAGQATPQSVLGGLWRCRRAVIVGDPLQLEPITTISRPLEDGILNHFKVDEEWLTRESSVQGRADRLNRLGTRVGTSGWSAWVGAPLTVHRRCDHPMFDIFDRIAYGGLMVDATDRNLAVEFAAEFRSPPPSQWIDVRTGESSGHWVPGEGRELARVLKGLAARQFDFRRAIVITPFRDVANGFRDITRSYRGLEAGTIHTAQGKEADIVILVLGSKADGDKARTWAARKPNLLNVAVSRARRRLYVIGDRRRWRGYRYFEDLDAGLPEGRPDPR